MTVAAINTGIIFQFVDEITSAGTSVRESTETGITLLSTTDNSAQQPRCATVISTRPECTFVKQDDIILIPALRWTSGLKYNGDVFWKTDESEVAVVRRNDQLVPMPGRVIFSLLEKETTKEVWPGFFVVNGSQDDTASGTVVAIGEGVSQELQNATIYYNGELFTDTIDKTNLAFIKEDDILVYSPND